MYSVRDDGLLQANQPLVPRQSAGPKREVRVLGGGGGGNLSARIEQQKVTVRCRWKVTVITKSNIRLFRLRRFGRSLDNNSRAVQSKTPSRKGGKVLLSPQTPRLLRLEVTSHGTIVLIDITRDVSGQVTRNCCFSSESMGQLPHRLGPSIREIIKIHHKYFYQPGLSIVTNHFPAKYKVVLSWSNVLVAIQEFGCAFVISLS